MRSQGVETHASPFTALKFSQALALIPTFDFFWFFIGLTLPLLSGTLVNVAHH